MTVIAIANQKGGVGKTTTAVNLVCTLAERGYKTLLIDTDAQCNSTRAFHAQTEDTVTLLDLLTGNEYSVEEAIQHTDVGDVIASDPGFEGYDVEVFRGIPRDDVDAEMREYRKLRDLIRGLDYDYIVIDTNPSVTTLLHNALVAADQVVVPLQASTFSFEGLGAFKDRVVRVKALMNPGINVAGMLFVAFRGNTLIHRSMYEQAGKAADMIGTVVFRNRIRNSVKVLEAEDQRIPLVKYSPSSAVAQDYERFTDELLSVIGKKPEA